MGFDGLTSFAFTNFHVGDQAILKSVDVLDEVVDDNVTGEITHDLVNAHGYASVRLGGDAYRLNVRIKNGELTDPIGANLLMSSYAAAFHPIGPIDFGGHQR